MERGINHLFTLSLINVQKTGKHQSNEFVHRLRVLESDDFQNEDPVEWPNTSGYVLKSDGFPVSEEATRHAYEIFNAVVEEARSHNLTCNGNREGPFQRVAEFNRKYFIRLIAL